MVEVSRAIDLLSEGRRQRLVLDPFADDLRPRDAATAYRIADGVALRLGLPLGGWKIGATSPKAMEMMGLAEPFIGRIFTPEILHSPARYALLGSTNTLVEAEYVAILARDLPARGRPYDRAEVEQAVASVHVGMEIAQPRYRSAMATDAFSVMADNGSNAGEVIGAAVADWRRADLAGQAVAIRVNGATITEGHGGNVMGHPMNALTWLANQRISCGDWLRAGQVISTGSCAGVAWLKPGDRAEADFGPFGIATLDATA